MPKTSSAVDESKSVLPLLSHKGNNWTLMVGENLTIYEVPKLREDFIANWHSGQSYTIDFSNTQDVDTAGIQLLLAMANKVMSNKGRWQITNIGDDTREFLDLYNLEALATSCDVENTENN